MTDPDEAPLRLQDLAEVDSPEVMRAALRRFRKRALIRGGGIAIIITALFVVPRALKDDRVPQFTERLATAQSHPIGRIVQDGGITALVLDARYVRPLREELPRALPPAGSEEPPPPYGPGGPESGYFLHIAVTADGIRNDESLEIFDESLAFFMRAPFLLENRPEDPRRSSRAGEGFLSFGKDQPTLTATVVAFTGKEGGARGPGSHTQAECAIPLSEVGVCELLKTEGRIVGTIEIDLTQFQIPSLEG